MNLVADFKKTPSILGLREVQAAEIAVREWVQRNRDEAQKRPDIYPERDIVINQPESLRERVLKGGLRAFLLE